MTTSRNMLIANLRQQREALDGLLARLEKKNSLDLVDFRFCEFTAEAVEKGLHRIRTFSTDAYVKSYLWGDESIQVRA